MFEYKVEQIDTEKTKPAKVETQLNALGKDDWELVAVTPDFDGEHILKAFLKRSVAR